MADFLKHRKFLIVVCNLLFIITAVSINRIYDPWRNSLHNNGKWTSTKTKLEKGVLGANAFMLTSYSLAGGWMNLGAWHGYQEVFLKDPPEYQKLDFTSLIRENSYLNVFFHSSGDTLSGLRISSNPDYPSVTFRSLDGKFIEKEQVAVKPDTSDWQHITLRFIENNLEIHLNDEHALNISTAYTNANILGFRGSRENVYIDNIWVFDSNNKLVAKEFFDPVRKSGWRWLIYGLALLIFNVVLILFLSEYLGLVSFSLLSLSTASVVFLVFYIHVAQYRYPRTWMINWHEMEMPANENEELVLNSIDQKLAEPKGQNEIRLLFLGSSQTWGAGASVEALTFINRFEAGLDTLCKQAEVNCINAGINGYTSNDILGLYRSSWGDKARADMVIINLSNNDYDHEIFRQSITELVKECKTIRADIVLISEPNDKVSYDLELNHEILAETGVTEDVKFLDMQTFLDTRLDDGFLFWDNVHLTDYGHEVVAGYLLHQLVNELCVDY